MARTQAVQTAQVGAVPLFAGKNAVINGGFDIWQRGTSFTSTNVTTAYGADRWSIYNGRTGTTYSRQTSGLTNFLYSMRVQRDSGNATTSDLFLTQCLESADSYRFAGQQVTFSFWAKAGANYSAASSSLTAQIRTGTGTDQNLWTGYTGTATIASLGATLTTSWQRFTVTGSAASTATELCILFAYTPTGTAGANDWFEITGVQLEVGSVATPFSRNASTIQGELAACQRYFARLDGSAYTTFGAGRSNSTTAGHIAVNLPVPMRVTATAAFSTASGFIIWTGSGATTALTAIGLNQGSKTALLVDITTAGSQTVGYGTILFANNSSSTYIEASAEL